MTDLQSDITTAMQENEAATHQVLDAVLRILSWIDLSPHGFSSGEIRRECTAIMEACAWQDIVGQRLARVAGSVPLSHGITPSGDPLLNGPASPGSGLTQQDVEKLLREE